MYNEKGMRSHAITCADSQLPSKGNKNQIQVPCLGFFCFCFSPFADNLKCMLPVCSQEAQAACKGSTETTEEPCKQWTLSLPVSHILQFLHFHHAVPGKCNNSPGPKPGQMQIKIMPSKNSPHTVSPGLHPQILQKTIQSFQTIFLALNRLLFKNSKILVWSSLP